MSKFSRLLEQIVTLGQGERLLQLTTLQSSTKCVAAGDPALPCADSEAASEKPESLEIEGQQIALAPQLRLILNGVLGTFKFGRANKQKNQAIDY